MQNDAQKYAQRWFLFSKDRIVCNLHKHSLQPCWAERHLGASECVGLSGLFKVHCSLLFVRFWSKCKCVLWTLLPGERGTSGRSLRICSCVCLWSAKLCWSHLKTMCVTLTCMHKYRKRARGRKRGERERDRVKDEWAMTQHPLCTCCDHISKNLLGSISISVQELTSLARNTILLS